MYVEYESNNRAAHLRRSEMDEAFEAWFKELYTREGFVSSKVELYAAWRAAMVAEREECAKACVTCAAAIRAR